MSEFNNYLDFITCTNDKYKCENFNDLYDIIMKEKDLGGLGGSVENNKKFDEDDTKNNYG